MTMSHFYCGRTPNLAVPYTHSDTEAHRHTQAEMPTRQRDICFRESHGTQPSVQKRSRNVFTCTEHKKSFSKINTQICEFRKIPPF